MIRAGIAISLPPNVNSSLRLYCGPRAERESVLQVLHQLLLQLQLSLGPVLPHLVEETAMHGHRGKGTAMVAGFLM